MLHTMRCSPPSCCRRGRVAKDEVDREHDAARRAAGDVKAAQRNTAAVEEELLQAKRQLQALRAEMAEREQETFRLKAAVAERDEANHRLDTDVRYLRRQVDDLHGKMTVKDETIAALEGREQQLRDQLHGAQRRHGAALRGSGGGGGAGLSTPSPATAGRTVTASLGATATSLSAGASTPRGSAYGSGGNAYAANPPLHLATRRIVSTHTRRSMAVVHRRHGAAAKRVAQPLRAGLRGGGHGAVGRCGPGGVPLAPAQGIVAERSSDSLSTLTSTREIR
jgi:hypothetical protein